MKWTAEFLMMINLRRFPRVLVRSGVCPVLNVVWGEVYDANCMNFAVYIYIHRTKECSEIL